MRRAALAAAALSLAASSALAQPERRVPHLGNYANPSAVISAEIEFARLTRDKGVVAAIRSTAADGAILLTPAKRIAVSTLISNGVGFDTGGTLDVSQVWSSCDGSYAVAQGVVHQSGQLRGTLIMLWQRQPKGGYKWLLLIPSAAASPAGSDMIAGNVAPCSAARRDRDPGGEAQGERRDRKPHILQSTIDPANGRSDDGSLAWYAQVDATGTGHFVVSVRGTGSESDREVMRVPLSPPS